MANLDKLKERNINIEASYDQLCFFATKYFKSKLDDKVLNANLITKEDLLYQYAESIVTSIVRTYSEIAPYSLLEILEYLSFGIDSFLIVLSREHEINDIEQEGYKVEVFDYLQKNNTQKGQEFTVGEFHGVVEAVSKLDSGPIYLITDLSRYDNAPYYIKT